MATKGELMRGGLAAELAQQLGDDIATGLTATGSTQGGALALVASMSLFSTVAASTGALLPSATGKGEYGVLNGGANDLAVYPATGEQINAIAANSAFTVTAGKCAFFKPHGNRWLAVLSA